MNDNQEHLMINPELGTSNPEKSPELKPDSIEQKEKTAVSHDKTPELSPRDVEVETEKARHEALENAKNLNSKSRQVEKEQNSSRQRRGVIGKKQLDNSYKQTMNQVQSQLPAGSRFFSKVIHNKFIDKTSDVIGNSIARPNAILSGAFFAFVLTLAAYTVAKTIGYRLSGFETILAFIIGWLIGIVYDYLRILFTGKKY